MDMEKHEAAVERQSAIFKGLGCLMFTLLLGLIDYITGDFSLFLFYIVPIAVAVWFVGKKTALLISVMSGVELFVVCLLVSPARSDLISIRNWNALMEAFFLVFAGYMFQTLKVELDLNRQRALQLETQNQELGAFNYSVSHDLEKPITVINGYSQLILQKNGNRLDAESRGFLDEIYRCTLRMDSIIHALLNFSRLANCPLNRAGVDLSALAGLVAAEFRQTDTKRQVTFKIAEGVVVYADKQLLKIVLENLVGNAWKYTANRQKALIEFGVTSRSGEPVYFVRDNGAGFDMSEAHKLFVPFERLHDPDDFKGHGIGLATVERIIKRHGGRIWAEGEHSLGATFYFTVPLGKHLEREAR